ncbi:hypothetical protein FRC09_015972 [Ceratobasidium sp. 395]|nr:hypothetical protein FRC09_015972 [Ceratobasidium sp. 395]
MYATLVGSYGNSLWTAQGLKRGQRCIGYFGWDQGLDFSFGVEKTYNIHPLDAFHLARDYTTNVLSEPIDNYAALNKTFTDHRASFRELAAHTLIQEFLEETAGDIAITPLPAEPPTTPHTGGEKPTPIDKIGIIGAGVSGLYAAMILDDLEVPYEILEANNRIGGRIYTHRFNGTDGENALVGDPARYDYFDVGAMRYPDIPFMRRVFDLFETIEIQNLLREYKLSDTRNHMYFNNIRRSNAQSTEILDPFKDSVSKGGDVPDAFLQEPDAVTTWIEKVYGKFKKRFALIDLVPPENRRQVFQQAWECLTKYDHLSTRGYMLSKHRFPESAIEWLEKYDSATGLYNLVFVESVLDSLDFDWPWPQNEARPFKRPVDEDDASLNSGTKAPKRETCWYCIDGGSDRIIKAMLAKLKIKPLEGKYVTRITETNDHSYPMVVDSVINGTASRNSYSQVICTASLGCVSTMDLKGANILYGQKVAIRSLNYDSSTKIGLRFDKRWWEDPRFMGKADTFEGGQSKTDLPIRVCAYPSDGLNIPPEERPGVLIASYTWAQDAVRLGSFLQHNDAAANEALLEIVLDNLAKLHGISRDKFPKPRAFFAHAWSNDRFTRGAFALFGPGQFTSYSPKCPPWEGREKVPTASSLFASIKAPAAHGKLHFAGEATSVHHAWVLGALNSAWRAIYNALEGHPELRQKLKKNWGIPDEETEITLKKLIALARYGRL